MNYNPLPNDTGPETACFWTLARRDRFILYME
jgi:hypothetical protein